MIFTDWYLPGYKAGGPITSCANLVENLGDEFNFRVVCGDRDYMETAAYSGVKTNEWTSVGKAEVMYLPPDRQSLSDIKSIIHSAKADMTYLNGMFSKAFTIFPLLTMRKNAAKVIVAPRGMLAPAALGIKPFKKKLFLKLAKLMGLFRGVTFHSTSAVESEQISARFGRVPIKEVENIPGVQQLSASRSEHKKKEKVLRLYSVARIAPEKNIHFALECLQNIESDVSVTFEIIGSVYDRDYFARCEKIVAGLPKNVKVQFPGTMPNGDIAQVAVKADYFFLPTAGENYGHAIVEAMLTGIPVVISTKTPWRNLKSAGLGFDLNLVREEFSTLLNELGNLTDEAYHTEYRNIKTNAKALINLDKLRLGYQNLFND